MLVGVAELDVECLLQEAIRYLIGEDITFLGARSILLERVPLGSVRSSRS